MSIVSSIFLGVVAFLQFFCIGPATYGAISYFQKAGMKLRAEDRPRSPSHPTMSGIFRVLLGVFLALFLVMLLPIILIVVVFLIQNYHELSYLIGLLSGVAAYRIKQALAERKHKEQI